MKKGNYDLVKEIVESYEDEDVMERFKSEFEEGKEVNEKEYFEFFMEFIDDMSETYYIRKNWEYIISGGDESVYDEDDNEEDDDWSDEKGDWGSWRWENK